MRLSHFKPVRSTIDKLGPMDQCKSANRNTNVPFQNNNKNNNNNSNNNLSFQIL